MIDANVTLFQWPFRRLRLDDPAALAEKLQSQGVQQAWAGTFDALLQRDVAAANARLAETCRRFPIFRPFGCVNPTLPDWEEDFRRCREEHGMHGLRLFPHFHEYALADPEPMKLLALAAEHSLLIQVPLAMEDERTQHPRLRFAPVAVVGLPALLRELPKLRLILLNAFRSVRLEEAKRLSAAGQVCFDIAMLEGVGGISNLLAQVPLERVLFGSYAPLFYPESAHLKLRESALTDAQHAAIARGNAAALLPGL